GHSQPKGPASPCGGRSPPAAALAAATPPFSPAIGCRRRTPTHSAQLVLTPYPSLATIPHARSTVAQRASIRLLAGGLLVGSQRVELGSPAREAGLLLDCPHLRSLL